MKIAIIIDKALPCGLAANTAAVLGISTGRLYPEIVREPVMDAEGNEYCGITSLVIPVLSADRKTIKELVQKARQDDVTLIPFTNIAQSCKDYDTYKFTIQETDPDTIQYSGIALAGSNKKISSYTGSLPLLR